MLLSDLFNLYIENHAKQRTAPRTLQAFTREFPMYVGPLAGCDIGSITRFQVVQLQAQMREEHGIGAANRAIELVTLLYNKAIDWELYEGRNPAARIRKFRIEPRERFLQPDELASFFHAVGSLRSATTRDFFLTLLFTGQRRRNVSEMRWEEVDMKSGIWRIPRTKNGTAHSVPLIEEAMIILTRRKGCHPVWVFPKEDGSGPIWCRYTAWLAILKRSGLSDLRMHDLRRTLASWQVMTGANLPIVGRTLNHSNPASTAIYARVHLDPVREAIQKAVRAMLDA